MWSRIALACCLCGITFPALARAGDPMESTVRMPTFDGPTAAERFLEREEAALEAEDARLFAVPRDTPGFAAHYQRSSNPFADGSARMQDGAFHPAARNDPDNPLNPMNRYNWDNPMNPMNAGNSRNPASEFNRGVYGLPFEPLR